MFDWEHTDRYTQFSLEATGIFGWTQTMGQLPSLFLGHTQANLKPKKLLGD